MYFRRCDAHWFVVWSAVCALWCTMLSLAMSNVLYAQFCVRMYCTVLWFWMLFVNVMDCTASALWCSLIFVDCDAHWYVCCFIYRSAYAVFHSVFSPVRTVRYTGVCGAHWSLCVVPHNAVFFVMSEVLMFGAICAVCCTVLVVLWVQMLLVIVMDDTVSALWCALFVCCDALWYWCCFIYRADCSVMQFAFIVWCSVWCVVYSEQCSFFIIWYKVQ